MGDRAHPGDVAAQGQPVARRDAESGDGDAGAAECLLRRHVRKIRTAQTKLGSIAYGEAMLS